MADPRGSGGGPGFESGVFGQGNHDACEINGSDLDRVGLRARRIDRHQSSDGARLPTLAQRPETVQIYVATADIDVNEQITASNVRVEDWPKSKVPEGAITDFERIAEY